MAALAAAALGNSCAIDGRPGGIAGTSGAGGDGQGGTETTSAGAGGGVTAGAGGDSAGSGGTSTTSSAGSDGLAGAGGNAAGQGGEGQGGAGGAGGAGTDAGPDVDPDPPLPVCASQRITGLGSATAATTAGGEGQFSLSCASGSADDVGVFWVAPEAGYYSIDTFGSSFDTALAVFSDNCTTELACNADAGEQITSEIVREFAAGEAVVFAVAGNSGSFGDVVVSTHAITCPVLDLNRQSPPVTTTTLDGTNQHSGACGGDGQLEKAFRWKSPSAGLFEFTASSQDFSPALYLERGARCGGEPISCNAGGGSSPATVVARLAEDEVVTLIVDAAEGAGSATVNVRDVSGDACPNQPGRGVFDGDVSGVLEGGDPSVLTGSCVPARQSVLPGQNFALPEHSYPITVGGLCDVTIIADGPVAVYVHEGLECGGRELVCQALDDASQGELVQADLGSLMGPAVDYVVTVEATNPNGAPVNYTLGFSCILI